MLAVQSLSGISKKLLVCLGFGVDTHHGVCHAHFLENVAALASDDAYLGAWSLLHDSDEFRFYREACDFTFARLPNQQSIVNTSIIAAVTGGYGDIHATKRTEGSTLFINPLMALYWGFSWRVWFVGIFIWSKSAIRIRRSKWRWRLRSFEICFRGLGLGRIFRAEEVEG